MQQGHAIDRVVARVADLPQRGRESGFVAAADGVEQGFGLRRIGRLVFAVGRIAIAGALLRLRRGRARLRHGRLSQRYRRCGQHTGHPTQATVMQHRPALVRVASAALDRPNRISRRRVSCGSAAPGPRRRLARSSDPAPARQTRCPRRARCGLRRRGQSRIPVPGCCRDPVRAVARWPPPPDCGSGPAGGHAPGPVGARRPPGGRRRGPCPVPGASAAGPAD
ncbi:hypothetical protein G6F31_016839 [Rhizopus arrhizus]|nr:hypothetical protein G6F31_016839 [Rhizopus arrhizus]